MNVKVKICGITNVDDAVAAAGAGADAVGLNFVATSPRYVRVDAARSIVKHLPNSVMKVGVFVNEDIRTIIEMTRSIPLDAVQFHGDESVAFVDQVRREFEGTLIKAFRVGIAFDPCVVRDYDVDGVLLDGFSTKAWGGTGEMFDWDIASHVSTLTDSLWLAGGLTPDNVGVAISRVHPNWVDACSSLESSHGVKDDAKVRRFIGEAKAS